MGATTFESLKMALHGRMAVRRYPFPGQPDLEVGIKLLTDAESDACRLRAQEKTTKLKANVILDPEFFDRVIKREVIATAFRQGGADDEFLFASEEQVRELDQQTVYALYELYAYHQQMVDPYASADEEEVTAIIDQLGKSETAAARLSLFDAQTLRTCVLFMAARLRATSPAPSSSTG
jgi:hypothetical protein